jgi:hypothetical protein
MHPSLLPNKLVKSIAVNPLLGKVKLPGRVFQLPSKGVFYQPGVLADSVKNGEIQVKPMSALAEIKLRAPDLLLSGKLLAEVCAECIPEILQPESLVNKDVDAVFCFLVISTYGEFKRVSALHDDCKKADKPVWHEYKINIELIAGAANNEILNHKDMIYETTLPNGQVVKLRPTTFERAIDAMNIETKIATEEYEGKKLDSKDVENLVLSRLMSIIESVTSDGDTVTDAGQIYEWLRVITKEYTTQIFKAYEKASEWGFDFQTKIICKDCKEPFPFDLELNPINFFSG